MKTISADKKRLLSVLNAIDAVPRLRRDKELLEEVGTAIATMHGGKDAETMELMAKGMGLGVFDNKK